MHARQRPQGSAAPRLRDEQEPGARPCAVIGPHPPQHDACAPRRAPWPAPPAQPDHRYPPRNISPRQTFQENMRRIMVPPRTEVPRPTDPSAPTVDFRLDENLSTSKTVKPNPPAEQKYCEAPYTTQTEDNRSRVIRNAEGYASTVPMVTVPARVWPTDVTGQPPPAYYPSETPYYSDYQSCAMPAVRPAKLPVKKMTEDAPVVYNETYYRTGDVRFEPYPTLKDKYPRPRYDYFPSPHPTYSHPVTQKYDLTKSVLQNPYIGYAKAPPKYIDSRVVDPNAELYSRQTQYIPNYNITPGEYIPPKFIPTSGNNSLQGKVYAYPVESGVRDMPAPKGPYDANRAYYNYDYGRVKQQFQVRENPYPTDMPHYGYRGPVPINNYVPSNAPQVAPNYLYYHHAENMPMKNYREHSGQFKHADARQSVHNPLAKIPAQFSPNIISPSESNTSLESINTHGAPLEDCGYVSQCSTASNKSIEYPHYKIHNYEHNMRALDNRMFFPMSHSTPNMKTCRDFHQQSHPTSKINKDGKNIDVRQFLQMWDEDNDDVCAKTKNNLISNTQIDKATNVTMEITGNQQPLYVLDLVNIPTEEIGKYEHIQKVCKLPENIKGYDSADLLEKFDEAFQPATAGKVVQDSNDSKHHLGKNIEKVETGAVLDVVGPARPLSPFDVEAKITQSVIHKEVGCNFEIKPCSPPPKTPDAKPDSLLNERKIEKIVNQHTFQSFSPAQQIESFDNGVKLGEKRRSQDDQEILHNKVMKTDSPQYVANHNAGDYIISAKEYNTVSGVCLASLPRLDNELELNFLEINQEYCDLKQKQESVITSIANTASQDNLEATEENITHSHTTLQKQYINDKNMIRHEGPTVAVKEDLSFCDYDDIIPISPNTQCTEKSISKLTKFRRCKPTDVTNTVDFRNDRVDSPQLQRTDSVIIKNPDNNHPALEDSILPLNKAPLATNMKTQSNWTPTFPSSQSSSQEVFSKSPINLIMHSNYEEYTECIRPSLIHCAGPQSENTNEANENNMNNSMIELHKSHLNHEIQNGSKSEVSDIPINVAINLSINSNQPEVAGDVLLKSYTPKGADAKEEDLYVINSETYKIKEHSETQSVISDCVNAETIMSETQTNSDLPCLFEPIGENEEISALEAPTDRTWNFSDVGGIPSKKVLDKVEHVNFSECNNDKEPKLAESGNASTQDIESKTDVNIVDAKVSTSNNCDSISKPLNLNENNVTESNEVCQSPEKGNSTLKQHNHANDQRDHNKSLRLQNMELEQSMRNELTESSFEACMQNEAFVNGDDSSSNADLFKDKDSYNTEQVKSINSPTGVEQSNDNCFTKNIEGQIEENIENIALHIISTKNIFNNSFNVSLKSEDEPENLSNTDTVSHVSALQGILSETCSDISLDDSSSKTDGLGNIDKLNKPNSDVNGTAATKQQNADLDLTFPEAQLKHNRDDQYICESVDKVRTVTDKLKDNTVKKLIHIRAKNHNVCKNIDRLSELTGIDQARVFKETITDDTKNLNITILKDVSEITETKIISNNTNSETVANSLFNMDVNCELPQQSATQELYRKIPLNVENIKKNTDNIETQTSDTYSIVEFENSKDLDKQNQHSITYSNMNLDDSSKHTNIHSEIESVTSCRDNTEDLKISESNHSLEDSTDYTEFETNTCTNIEEQEKKTYSCNDIPFSNIEKETSCHDNTLSSNEISYATGELSINNTELETSTSSDQSEIEPLRCTDKSIEQTSSTEDYSEITSHNDNIIFNERYNKNRDNFLPDVGDNSQECYQDDIESKNILNRTCNDDETKEGLNSEIPLLEITEYSTNHDSKQVDIENSCLSDDRNNYWYLGCERNTNTKSVNSDEASDSNSILSLNYPINCDLNKELGGRKMQNTLSSSDGWEKPYQYKDKPGTDSANNDMKAMYNSVEKNCKNHISTGFQMLYNIKIDADTDSKHILDKNNSELIYSSNKINAASFKTYFCDNSTDHKQCDKVNLDPEIDKTDSSCTNIANYAGIDNEQLLDRNRSETIVTVNKDYIEQSKTIMYQDPISLKNVFQTDETDKANTTILASEVEIDKEKVLFENQSNVIIHKTRVSVETDNVVETIAEAAKRNGSSTNLNNSNDNTSGLEEYNQTRVHPKIIELTQVIETVELDGKGELRNNLNLGNKDPKNLFDNQIGLEIHNQTEVDTEKDVKTPKIVEAEDGKDELENKLNNGNKLIETACKNLPTFVLDIDTMTQSDVDHELIQNNFEMYGAVKDSIFGEGCVNISQTMDKTVKLCKKKSSKNYQNIIREFTSRTDETVKREEELQIHGVNNTLINSQTTYESENKNNEDQVPNVGRIADVEQLSDYNKEVYCLDDNKYKSDKQIDPIKDDHSKNQNIDKIVTEQTDFEKLDDINKAPNCLNDKEYQSDKQRDALKDEELMEYQHMDSIVQGQIDFEKLGDINKAPNCLNDVQVQYDKLKVTSKEDRAYVECLSDINKAANSLNDIGEFGKQTNHNVDMTVKDQTDLDKLNDINKATNCLNDEEDQYDKEIYTLHEGEIVENQHIDGNAQDQAYLENLSDFNKADNWINDEEDKSDKQMDTLKEGEIPVNQHIDGIDQNQACAEGLSNIDKSDECLNDEGQSDKQINTLKEKEFPENQCIDCPDVEKDQKRREIQAHMEEEIEICNLNEINSFNYQSGIFHTDISMENQKNYVTHKDYKSDNKQKAEYPRSKKDLLSVADDINIVTLESNKETCQFVNLNKEDYERGTQDNKEILYSRTEDIVLSEDQLDVNQNHAKDVLINVNITDDPTKNEIKQKNIFVKSDKTLYTTVPRRHISPEKSSLKTIELEEKANMNSTETNKKILQHDRTYMINKENTITGANVVLLESCSVYDSPRNNINIKKVNIDNGGNHLNNFIEEVLEVESDATRTQQISTFEITDTGVPKPKHVRSSDLDEVVRCKDNKLNTILDAESDIKHNENFDYSDSVVTCTDSINNITSSISNNSRKNIIKSVLDELEPELIKQSARKVQEEYMAKVCTVSENKIFRDKKNIFKCTLNKINNTTCNDKNIERYDESTSRKEHTLDNKDVVVFDSDLLTTPKSLLWFKKRTSRWDQKDHSDHEMLSDIGEKSNVNRNDQADSETISNNFLINENALLSKHCPIFEMPGLKQEDQIENINKEKPNKGTNDTDQEIQSNERHVELSTTSPEVNLINIDLSSGLAFIFENMSRKRHRADRYLKRNNSDTGLIKSNEDLSAQFRRRHFSNIAELFFSDKESELKTLEKDKNCNETNDVAVSMKCKTKILQENDIPLKKSKIDYGLKSCFYPEKENEVINCSGSAQCVETDLGSNLFNAQKLQIYLPTRGDNARTTTKDGAETHVTEKMENRYALSNKLITKQRRKYKKSDKSNYKKEVEGDFKVKEIIPVADIAQGIHEKIVKQLSVSDSLLLMTQSVKRENKSSLNIQYNKIDEVFLNNIEGVNIGSVKELDKDTSDERYTLSSHGKKSHSVEEEALIHDCVKAESKDSLDEQVYTINNSNLESDSNSFSEKIQSEHIMCMEPDSTQECHGTIDNPNKDSEADYCELEKAELVTDFSSNECNAEICENSEIAIIDNPGNCLLNMASVNIIELEECDSSQNHESDHYNVADAIINDQEQVRSHIDGALVNNEIPCCSSDSPIVNKCVLMDENCVLLENPLQLNVGLEEINSQNIVLDVDDGVDTVHENNSKKTDDVRIKINAVTDSKNLRFVMSASANDSLTYDTLNSSNAHPGYEEIWIDDVACVETVVSEEIIEEDSDSGSQKSITERRLDDFSELENDYTHNVSYSFDSDKIKHIYGRDMDNSDIHIVETFYRTPHMEVRNKLNESDININSSIECNLDTDSNIGADVTLETSSDSNQTNSECSEKDSSVKRVDSEDKSDDENSLKNEAQISSDKNDDLYKVKNKSLSLAISYARNDGPYSENVDQGLRCKFTESDEDSATEVVPNLNSPTTRKFLTKAARKYIPPIEIAFHNLKVKLPLPEESLEKLKDLKTTKNRKHERSPIPKLKINTSNLSKHIETEAQQTKKVKPKFEDVLKHIDEAHRLNLKLKHKKKITGVPKVIIKKTENGSHYTSTAVMKPNRDLTGSKWQPWVYLERNNLVDKMIAEKKRKAYFCHKTDQFVLRRTETGIRPSPILRIIPRSSSNGRKPLKYTISLNPR